MAQSPDLDAQGLIERLDAAGVRYVVVGGVAAVILGSPSLTMDLDICYARDPENLVALAAVLGDAHSRLRGVTDDVPFKLDAATLAAGSAFTFTTDLGDLDVIATPAGTQGFDDLVRDATPVEIGGRTVLVASIDDLIRMKLAAGRPKDRVEVEILGALREEMAEYG